MATSRPLGSHRFAYFPSSRTNLDVAEPRKASLLVVFLTVFIDLLGFGMVLPLLPIYAEDFAAQFGWFDDDWRLGLLIGLLMSSFSLMQFLFTPLWGRLSDRIGRRPVLMVGLAGSVAFYTLFGIATVLRSIPLLFVARIGAGISGATIATAQAYIADATSLENGAKGMALIGAAFGLGFTFGPLFGALAVLHDSGAPSPWPGYAAAILSAGALLLAYFKLPESLKPGNENAKRKWLDLVVLKQALGAPSIGLLLLTSFICVFSFANFETTLSLTLKRQSRRLQLLAQRGFADVRLHRPDSDDRPGGPRSPLVGQGFGERHGRQRSSGGDCRLSADGPDWRVRLGADAADCPGDCSHRLCHDYAVAQLAAQPP